MNQLTHMFMKMKEVGVLNCIEGGVKRERYKVLQKKYQFDMWHISPYELHKYLQAIAEYINSNNAKVVVDVGCGLGEMLRHIKAEDRLGVDVEKEVIEVAKILCKDNVVYEIGSFDRVDMERPIDYLVSVGFTHGSTEEKLRPCYYDVAQRNDVKHFVVDTVPEGYDGAHYIDYSITLPENYKLIEKMGPFLGGRIIEIYEKC